MEAKLLQLAQHRFAISRTGDTLDLKGVLFAGSGLERFSDIFCKAEIINLESLVFASWAGIEEFLAFLNKFEKHFQIANVREHFIEAFLLQVAELPLISIVQFYVTPNLVKANECGAHSLERLNQQGLESNSSELEAIEEAFSGSFCQLMGQYVKNHHLEGLERMLDHLNQNAQDFQFLFLCFLHGVVRTTLNQVQTIACSTLRNVMQIFDRIEGIDRGLLILGLPPKFSVDRAAALAQLESEFSELSHLLVGIRDELAHWLKEAKKKSASGSAFHATAQLQEEKLRLEALHKTLKDFAARSDEIGVSASCMMMPFACGSEVAQSIDSLISCPPADDQLQQLSASFYVVDAFAAEAWDTLKPEIKTELDLLDSMVMNMTIELQGFDAAKQIIEKRALEIKFLIDFMSHQQAVLDTAFEKAFVEVIAGKLVTVQERKTFGAYLSNYKKIEQELINTQEVSFFI